MLKDLFDILETFGTESVEMLRDEHQAAGQVASGKTLDSFRHEVDEVGLKVFGAGHVEWLDRGRGPGGFPPVDKIKKWVYDKGLAGQFDKEYKLNSFVYLIGRKMAEEGSLHHRTGKTFAGAERPIFKVFNEERINKLKELLGSVLKIEITSEVLKEYKKIENGNT